MSYRNRTLSEKKRIYKKLGLVITAILVVCIVLAIALRPTKGNASHNASGTQAVEGMIEVDGVKYVPKKNIETYLFMGIDNMGKVQKVTDYEGAGRCDVVMLMVRDLTDGTYKTLSIDRNTIVEQDTLDPDGTYVATSPAQLALAHENGDGMEISCENVVKAVSNFLGGQKIDGYAAVNMGAIGTINNLAGGVTVTIEDDFSKVDKTMKQGETITLTDEQAVHFIHDLLHRLDRWSAAGHIGQCIGSKHVLRMKRQEVYKAGLKDNLEAKCSEDNTYPLTIYDALGDYMVTDISSQKFSKLALLVLKEKDAGTVSIAGTETVDDLGFVEVEPDADSLQQAIVELFYKEYN